MKIQATTSGKTSTRPLFRGHIVGQTAAQLWHIKPNQRIFLTGHTGFKGSWLALLLTKMGAQVCGYSLKPNTTPSMFNALDIGHQITRSVTGNILDTRKLNQTMQEFQPDIVFHLAAQPIVRCSYENPQLTYRTNLLGSLNVLEAARHCKSVRAFVNVTTDKCYDNKGVLRNYKETDAMGGYDPYSASKACVEIMTESYRRSFLQSDSSMALATARAGNTIGGGDWGKHRLIPNCVRAINSNEKIKLPYPNAVRPWQHVLDALSGYLMLGQKLLEEGKTYASGFNFGPQPNKTLTVFEVAQKVCQLYGKGDISVVPKDNLHEEEYVKLSIAKARKMLGWQPTFSPDIAIRETVDWYRHFYNKDTNMLDFTLQQIDMFEKNFKNK